MFQSYQEFINYMNLYFSVFQNIKADTKEECIHILKNYRFYDVYEIASAPETLNQFGIFGTIYLSLSNFAYIASRHIHEYELDVYFKMKEVIEDYVLLLHGNQEGNKDFRFYKRTESPSFSFYSFCFQKRKTHRLPFINMITCYQDSQLRTYRMLKPSRY